MGEGWLLGFFQKDFTVAIHSPESANYPMHWAALNATAFHFIFREL
jgi:hypothetical protein